MTKKLPTYLPNIDSLETQRLVLLYGTEADYSQKRPELNGVVRLIHQSSPRVWDIKYRDAQTGVLRDALVNLDNFDTVVGVSLEADSYIGKKEHGGQ